MSRSNRSDEYLKIANQSGNIENGYDDNIVSDAYCPINNVKRLEIKQDHVKNYKNENEFYDGTSESTLLSSPSVPSYSLIGENDSSSNGIDIDTSITEQQQSVQSDFASISPCNSHTELKTVIQSQQTVHKSHDDFEFIVKPMIMVNIQDTVRSNVPSKFDDTSNQIEFQAKSIDFIRESEIAVNQHMSILIKKLSSEVVDQKSTYDSYMDETSEGNFIIKEVFNK